MIKNRSFQIVLIILFTLRPAAAVELHDKAELMLHKVMQTIENQQLHTALQQIDELIKTFPDFKLAHLIRGDLYSSLAQGTPLIKSSDLSNGTQSLYDEARARLNFSRAENAEQRLPANILRLADTYNYVLLFELSKSRLYLIENNAGLPQVIADHYISIGKAGMRKQYEGDNRTPLGVYRVTSHLADEELPKLYGHGAYPIDYPNNWDKLKKRTGHGIWLHGVPKDTYSRPPLDSEGCMVISNEGLDQLASYIAIGNTPVVLTDTVTWQDKKTFISERLEIEQQIEQWRLDWESTDVERYLSHYSENFKNFSKNIKQWNRHKRSVGKSKKFIEVTLSNLDIFIYPSEDDLLVARFEQNYRSNNFTSTTNKQIFMKKESDGIWRIVFEG